MDRLTDRPAMTIAVDLGRKATKQTNKQSQVRLYHRVVNIAICYTDIISVS